MYEKLDVLKGSLGRIQTSQVRNGQAMASLRVQSKSLTEEKAKIKKEFIRQAMEQFIKKMTSSHWQKQKYITGSYSDDFTKFVSRTNVSVGTLTEAHREAKYKFIEAYQNLNEVFLKELLSNSENIQADIIEYAGLKNLGDANE